MTEDREDSSAVESTDKHSSQREAKESWTPAVRWEGGKRAARRGSLKKREEEGGGRKEGGQGNDGGRDVNHRRESEQQ